VDEDASDEERDVGRVVPRSPVRAVPYRFVNEPVKPPEESVMAQVMWSYDAPLDGQHVRRKRDAMSWMQSERGKEAVELLRRRFMMLDDDYGVSAMRPLVVDEDVVKNVEVEVEPPITARSPGGTGIVEIRADVYGRMARGEALRPDMTVELIKVLEQSSAVGAFVKTTVFDGWSPPWTSMWTTFSSQEVLKECLVKNVHGSVMKLVQGMYARFRDEAISFFATSNLYRDKVKRLFAVSLSINKLAKMIKEGRVPIAQSDMFVDRWLRMLDMHDKALTAMERAHVFDPMAVTAAQANLPIDRGGKSNYVPLPRDIVKEWSK
jgi:hypothetical protein